MAEMFVMVPIEQTPWDVQLSSLLTMTRLVPDEVRMSRVPRHFPYGLRAPKHWRTAVLRPRQSYTLQPCHRTSQQRSYRGIGCEYHAVTVSRLEPRISPSRTHVASLPFHFVSGY